MRDVYNAIKSLVSLFPATRTTDANGTGVDAMGYESAKLVIVAGDIDLASTDETYAFKVQHSEDNSTWADISGATATITADNSLAEIQILGIGTSVNRYLRAVLDVGGTTPSIPCSAVFELGRAQRKPVR